MNVDFEIFKRISIAYDFKAINIEFEYFKGFQFNLTILLLFMKLRIYFLFMIMNYRSKIILKLLSMINYYVFKTMMI